MASVIQRSLAGGELAPALGARADQAKYQSGLKTCRNFKVRREGGVENRTGTKQIVEVKTSSLATYFITFAFNADQTYVIEVGNQYFRFIRNGAQIVVSGVAAWVTATAYAVGDLVSNGGTNYYCKTAHTSAAAFATDAANWHALTGSIFEIPTPYVTADLSTLDFFQSGDVVTIVHPSYAPRELARTGHTAWTLTTLTTAPSISAPANLSATAGGAGSLEYSYVVTAVKTETYEESVASTADDVTTALPTTAAPVTLAWDAVAGAVEYNVYADKVGNGVYGFIGVAASNAFNDTAIEPDLSITPPIARTLFASTDNYPSTGGYYQQRLMLANTNNDPEQIQGSRTGSFKNFTKSSPLQEDDAISFTIAGSQVQEVRHLIGLKRLLVLTEGGEWIIRGDADGALRANQPVNPDQEGYNGAAAIKPVVIGNSVVYVQARGSIMRDLRYELQADGYTGKDLTVFASHLFRKRTLTRMAYAQNPDSIVWVVRSDGTLLGLTYLREHEVWGWHRHDTDGTYEDVCVVPEGDEDAVYVIVKRTIDGATKRYIERFASGFNAETDDIETDALFLDSFLTYDGTNTGSTTMTLSTAAGWTTSDTITITASAGYFVSGDVGNSIVLWDADEENEVEIEIGAYTSATVVTGTPSKTVPTALRSTALTTWGKAVDAVSGLSHLEGKEVAILGDGNVVANPNNPAYTVYTVDSAALSPELSRNYLVIHVGLPITADIETLELDAAGEQVRDKKKNITAVDLLVQSTRGLWVGERFPEDIAEDDRVDEDDLTEGLSEQTPEPIDDYNDPIPMADGLIEIPIASTWRQSGSFVARQLDPLPCTILAVIPNGQIGG